MRLLKYSQCYFDIDLKSVSNAENMKQNPMNWTIAIPTVRQMAQGSNGRSMQDELYA